MSKKSDGKILTIIESFDMLKKYNIPIADYGVAKTIEDAVTAAKEIGYPVVMKLVSEKVTHKTDVGGIIVDIDSDKELQAAFDKIKKKTKQAKADFGGVVVQKMLGAGGVAEAQEVIVGGKTDPQFGQTIAFGIGGVFVEIFEDVAFRVVPIDEKDADSMIKETKVYKILAGARGKKYDIEAVSKILMKVSKMLDESKNIVELDINPVMVLEKGAFAVDARVVIK